MKKILITGGAGFIGASLSKQLLENSVTVIGFDNLNDYYDVNLKLSRLKILNNYDNYTFIKGDLADSQSVNHVIKAYKPNTIINLGAQAGVRYSISNPRAYIDSNIIGFFNILEACRATYEGYNNHLEHLIYASSSSVYGNNTKVPYSINDNVDNPISLYAATKKSNELMAYSYSKLYGIPCTGLRFFTVYGPMGRPDMAYFGFTNNMVFGKKIQVYNYGDMYRDFTYIDDIVEGICRIINHIPNKNKDGVPYKLYNIGNSKPESLKYFIETLEQCLIKEHIINRPAEKEYLPMQPGDVYQTYADVTELETLIGFKPHTSLELGLSYFAKWYKEYYNL